MTRLDANLDACRLTTDILLRLRTILREALRSQHGDRWDTAGIPEQLHEYVTQRQAHEASINWNLSDSSDALDYAGFANLYEIIAANEALVQRFAPLASDPALLRIRFLELDTIANRVAYARPVPEADLGLLASFDERLKRSGSIPAAAEDKALPPTPPQRASDAPSAASGSEQPAADPVPTPAPVNVPPTPPVSAPTAREKTRPSAPRAHETGTPVSPTAAVQEKAGAMPDLTPAPAPLAVAMPTVSPQELDAALRRGDTRPVLIALYQEVTALADGLWNGTISELQAKTFERVRESSWYHDNFAKLGLRPISDFFSLFDTAKERLLSGTSRNQLQDFLKDHNFVQVLLALKELFRQHMKK